MTDIWETRAQSAIDAISRTRYAFLASIVFSVAVIVAEYNTHFSWYVGNALEQHFPREEVSQVTKLGREETLRDWIKSKRVTVSLVGINFGTADAAILGSTTLYILAIWLFFTARRENHLIGSLLNDAAQQQDVEVWKKVYHGIANHLVFVTVTDDDRPIDSLGAAALPSQKPVFLVRGVFVVLLFMPAIAIGFVLLCDIQSLFRTPIMRWPHEKTLMEVIFNSDNTWQKCMVVLGDAFSLTAGTLSFLLCRNIWHYQRATGKLMLDFYAKHASK